MKPPVVVIERHCKTNQCWIAVRFKKIQSVAKISQSAAEKRADDALAKRVPLAAVAEKYFRHACARHSRKFYSRPRYPFALATFERHRRAPQTPRRASRRADGRAVASSRSRPMRDPDHHAGIAKKGRRGPRGRPKERPGCPRTIPRGKQQLLRVPSPSVRSAADQQRPRARRQLPDSFPLNVGWETAATSTCAPA